MSRGLLATLPVVGKLLEASGIASPEAETLNEVDRRDQRKNSTPRSSG